MNKCRNPEHPHCTRWVMQGADACGAGHAQPASGTDAAPLPAVAAATAPEPSSSSPDLLSARSMDPPVQPDRRHGVSTPAERRGQVQVRARPTLHVSGFDPRAAGGRQALRLELRGMPHEIPAHLSMHLRSALLAQDSAHRDFARTRNGEWPPAVIEFSSRGREHGQYPIDVELLAFRDGAPPRRWTCTLVILVPRPDATLTEIHQTFLATHKNVRVMADDASIARLAASTGGGRLDIDLTARNASIAQLNLDSSSAGLSLPSIAWDEELIETGVAGGAHPQPVQAACLVNAVAQAGGVRHIRLFAFDECVLGRREADAPVADVLLAHHGEHGADDAGLTRRLSAQHAIVRHGLHGFEIEDISRYGLLLDGVWPGKYVPVTLRAGMRIELTASVRNIVTLEVATVLPHAVVLNRIDAGQSAECFCFFVPDQRPPAGLHGSSSLPLLYHANGGFWHLDRKTGREIPLCDGARCAGTSFAATPYPELGLERMPRRPRDMRTWRSRAVLSPA